MGVVIVVTCEVAAKSFPSEGISRSGSIDYPHAMVTANEVQVTLLSIYLAYTWQ